MGGLGRGFGGFWRDNISVVINFTARHAEIEDFELGILGRSGDESLAAECEKRVDGGVVDDVYKHRS